MERCPNFNSDLGQHFARISAWENSIRKKISWKSRFTFLFIIHYFSEKGLFTVLVKKLGFCVSERLIDVSEEREGSSRESTLQSSRTILRSLWSLGTFKTHFFKGRTCEISIQGLLLPDLHLHIFKQILQAKLLKKRKCAFYKKILQARLFLKKDFLNPNTGWQGYTARSHPSKQTNTYHPSRSYIDGQKF